MAYQEALRKMREIRFTTNFVYDFIDKEVEKPTRQVKKETQPHRERIAALISSPRRLTRPCQKDLDKFKSKKNEAPNKEVFGDAGFYVR